MSELSYFSELVRQWLAYHGMQQVDNTEHPLIYHLTVDAVGDIHIGYLAADESIVLFSDIGALNELPADVLKKCLALQHFKTQAKVSFALDEESERLIVWLKTQLNEATIEALDQLLAQLIDEGLLAFKRMLTENSTVPIMPGVIV